MVIVWNIFVDTHNATFSTYTQVVKFKHNDIKTKDNSRIVISPKKIAAKCIVR